jgi:hypothetical protein
MPVTADDLLSLCSAVHTARLGLVAVGPAPRIRTLGWIAGDADRNLTDAALAYERGGAQQTISGCSRSAADALAFAAELAMIGIDEHGYVRLPDGAPAVLAPSDEERAAHSRFLDDVAGVPASLFTLAGSLEEHVDGPPCDDELLAELVDEATLELRRSAATTPLSPEEREAGMVWMTFCRMVLDEAMSALESSGAAAPSTLAHLAGLQRALDPGREPARLADLASSMPDRELG